MVSGESLPSPPAGYLVLTYALLLTFPWLWGRLQHAGIKPRIWAVAVCAALLVLPLGALRWRDDRQAMVDVIPLSYRAAALYVRSAGSADPLVIMPARAGYWDGRTVTEDVVDEAGKVIVAAGKSIAKSKIAAIQQLPAGGRMKDAQ